jgi:hypothetical protein
MSDSTDDEAYDYDETGRESDDYSDDFGDETDDDAVDASPARTNSAEPSEPSPGGPTGASMAVGADVSQAASSAAAASARFQAAAAAVAAAPTPAADETSGASDTESATRALQALNLMATGVVSHTDALLRGFDSAEAFASRVRAIASAQPLANRPPAATVERMIAELKPMCARVNGGFARTSVVADPTPPTSDAVTPTGATPGDATGDAAAGGPQAGAPSLPQQQRRPITDVAAAARAAVNATPDPPPDPSDKDAVLAHKLQGLRVNLLRIATRLGQSPRNTVVAQVIYRLELAEQLKSGKKQSAGGRGSSSSFDRAVALAESAERREGSDSDLGFTCTILLLGKSGVGKSSTINSRDQEGARGGAQDAGHDASSDRHARFTTQRRGHRVQLQDHGGREAVHQETQTGHRALFRPHGPARAVGRGGSAVTENGHRRVRRRGLVQRHRGVNARVLGSPRRR